MRQLLPGLLGTSQGAGTSPGPSLEAALTMEGLLFAAFSVGYGLARPARGGRHPFFTQGWLGWCIVAVIAVVAVSAGAAWWATFEPKWPPEPNEAVQAVGLAIGIVAQPVFAALINSQARKE